MPNRAGKRKPPASVGTPGARDEPYAEFCFRACARRWSSVWDGRRRPPRAAYPRLTVAGVVGVGHTSPPIWPCSDWGLQCRSLLPGARWALTPPFHPYLTCVRRFAFCCPVRRLSAPRRYLAVYPVELGLSSKRLAPPRDQPVHPVLEYNWRRTGIGQWAVGNSESPVPIAYCPLPQPRPSTAPLSRASPAWACCTKVSSGSSAPRQVATTSLNSRVARSASPSRS